MCTTLRRLGPLVPPCVWAAVLKAMMGGWTMMHADARRTHCCFGCNMGQDFLWHYAHCPNVADLALRRLRLAPSPDADRLMDFLMMNGQYNDSHLARGALRLYATYMATNAIRNERTAGASEAWIQAMTEAAGCDAPVGRMVAAFWSAPPTSP